MIEIILGAWVATWKAGRMMIESKTAELWTKKEIEIMFEWAEIVATTEDKMGWFTARFRRPGDELETRIEDAIKQVRVLISFSRKVRLLVNKEVGDILQELVNILHIWICDVESHISNLQTSNRDYKWGQEIYNKAFDIDHEIKDKMDKITSRVRTIINDTKP